MATMTTDIRAPRHIAGRAPAAIPARRLLLGLALLALAATLATLPFALMIANAGADRTAADAHRAAAAAMPAADRRRELEAARDYNRRLADDGAATALARDPWGAGADPSASDATYMGLLDTPADGIMARIRYPRLGIDLPVRHGTGETTLAAGAGHMYGSSLPVGGKGSHTVISAHTGLADRLMFDRLSLGQGRVGDVFYITVLDETLAYRVTSIRTVDPTDTDWVRPDPDRDEATLLTCTPYGVLNKRLLVTGERTTMPVPAPRPEDAPRDPAAWAPYAWIAAVWAAAGLMARPPIRAILRNAKGRKQ